MSSPRSSPGNIPAPRPASNAILYELAWILPSVALPVAMLVAISLSAFGMGIHVPGIAGRINPAAVSTTAPFDNPGLTQTGPGHYRAVLIAEIWRFTPNEIRVPRGSTVEFVITSKDVVHGVKIVGTPVNMMIVPGQVAHIHARLDQPGEYLIVCHEYCGAGHHSMYGKVIVE